MLQKFDEDVLEQILSHLQVKDLLRFKSVSKKWNSIISTPRFVNLHLNKSMSTPSHHRIIMPYPKSFRAVDFHIMDVQDHLPRPEEAVGTFVGSSGGLICYLDKLTRRICVWNPSLRLSKTLDLNIQGSVSFFWFGRESSDDEYKVVLGIRSVVRKNTDPNLYAIRRITIMPDQDEYRNHIYVIMPFACVSESSTQLEVDHIYFSSSDEGTLFSGLVHWFAGSYRIKSAIGSIYHDAVFTYDLGGKTLGKLSTPVGLSSSTGSIGVIDGCLSAIYRVCGGDCAIYEFWMMKEYGVKESWTKMTSLSFGNCDDGLSSFSRLKLVGATDTGDLILCCAPDCQLLIYNVAEKKSKIVLSNGYGFARMYVETLVFP
ncbi:hypothetical protein ABFS82_07G070000 [Erythranthe guttata]|uniref:F-box domain-containing protein n=1 Tax=Erythranthe guttata TaxID=4155 RepID=A0A022QUD4_ERYGU|nr:PREDICTED: F-box/kelch-repeat protein At3g23880-like [Erythranthe guttata]EYU31491.1 hypothetical protein MIMGU_mgv1a020142mg [Erythranthe guttata]|eukprot:XP_012844586.1 PREDICTED: F-box/kelch-repeat protein At3g23880-like [Erythranthe guttata]